MYYTNGNYEAFARPRKPQGVGEKQAWLVGGGLASLAAAAFLVRDAQMDGSRIHILEDSGLPGGACDGLLRPDVGFVIRGGREMENHYECLWDLFRSVPSLEVEDASVLDEFYWLNHDDPNCSKNRATLEQGASADTKNRFELSDEAALELMRLFFTPDEALYDKTIDDVPCMMPYVTAFFMPRAAGDRPDVIPEGCVNFAFLGQFAETPRDTIFTTEYSVRTAMEAVYTLLGIERGVPEVYASVYDVRCLLNAAHYLLDGRRLTEMKLPLPYKMALHAGLEKLRGTTLDELLVRYELV